MRYDSRLVQGLVLIVLGWSLALPSWGYRAVQVLEFGGIDQLQLVEIAELPEPGPGEVRLRVHAASASFTDVMVRKGMYQGAPGETPLIPGYDLVGVVDALGDGVSGVEVGARVAALTVWGAYSEYVVQPADLLVPVPDGLTAQKAVALVLSYTTAYQMLHRVAEVAAQDSVLIHGASGAVGTALSQLGQVSDLRMIGTASATKLDYVRRHGVEPVDYRSEDFVQRVDAFTEGRGVDAAFDAVSLENFRRSYASLADDGQLVTYGLYTATLSGTAGLGSLIWEFIGLMWQQFVWNWFPYGDRAVQFYSITEMRDAHPDWFREDLARLFQLADDGDIVPYIDLVLPLEEAAQAHRLIESGSVRGKIVFQVADE